MRLGGNGVNRSNTIWQQVQDAQPGLRIASTISYMKEHLNEPLRAATLASVARMSLPHYFVIFKRCTGSTPIDYFIRLRMERARELLATTSCSVKEIAGVLGYDDPLYFSRVFKAVNETTPTQYRSNNGVQKLNGSGSGTFCAVKPG
jgi:AraC-like DNA-binding protein